MPKGQTRRCVARLCCGRASLHEEAYLGHASFTQRVTTPYSRSDVAESSADVVL